MSSSKARQWNESHSDAHDGVIIELQDVWKIYKMGSVEVPALRGVNLKIHKGSFVAVMGASGSGKSTCMNMIGCLDVPTKGKVYLDGQDVSLMSESALAQIRGRKIGFVFQTFNLIPTLTALENVMLPMTFQNIPKHKREKRARELLEMVELGDRTGHKPGELSGGQQQRVAISRALSNDPELVLADEPTGNLDSKMGVEVMSFLSRLNKEEGKTVVMVTHDSNGAKHAEMIHKLMDGRIVGSEVGEGQQDSSTGGKAVSSMDYTSTL